MGFQDFKKVVEAWDDRGDYARKPEEWIPVLNIVMMIVKRSGKGERWGHTCFGEDFDSDEPMGNTNSLQTQ